MKVMYWRDNYPHLIRRTLASLYYIQLESSNTDQGISKIIWYDKLKIKKKIKKIKKNFTITL